MARASTIKPSIILRCNLFVVILFSAIFSCNTKTHSKEEIESAMKNYDRLIEKTDADSIALVYAKDGQLGSIANGRDSIRKFLARFKDFHVLSQETETRSIVISGDSAIQKGIYHQVTITPKKDTVHVSGEFEATWIWNYEGGWLLKKMETKPLK
jgi:ketosteroid isomerase-like protein